jgi:uncharacterized protein (DUF885 family)
MVLHRKIYQQIKVARFEIKVGEQMKNIIRKHIVGVAALAIMFSAPVHADANQELGRLLDDYWFSVLEEPAIFPGTLVANNNYSAVGNSTLAAQDHQAALAAAYLEILQTLPKTELKPAARVEYAILTRTLSETIEANRFGQRSMNTTGQSGWYLLFAEMAAEGAFATVSDFENYNDRLQGYPAINDQLIEVANAAINGKHTLPCDVFDGYENTLAPTPVPALPNQHLSLNLASEAGTAMEAKDARGGLRSGSARYSLQD